MLLLKYNIYVCTKKCGNLYVSFSFCVNESLYLFIYLFFLIVLQILVGIALYSIGSKILSAKSFGVQSTNILQVEEDFVLYKIYVLQWQIYTGVVYFVANYYQLIYSIKWGNLHGRLHFCFLSFGQLRQTTLMTQKVTMHLY